MSAPSSSVVPPSLPASASAGTAGAGTGAGAGAGAATGPSTASVPVTGAAADSALAAAINEQPHWKRREKDTLLWVLALKAIAKAPTVAVTTDRWDRASLWLSKQPLKHDASTVKTSIIQAIVRSGNVVDDLFPPSLLAGVKSLPLGGAGQFSNRYIVEMTQASACLTDLDVGLCANLTDEGVEAIVTHAGGLQSLSIEGCRCISSSGLMSLKKATHLRRLNIGGCYNATADAVHELVMTHPNVSQFEELHLSGLELLPATIDGIPTHCTALVSLGLGFTNTTDTQVHNVIASLPLVSLRLHWCPHITDKALTSLGQFGHHLQSLDILGAKRITNFGLRTLITTACPSRAPVAAHTTPSAPPRKLLHINAKFAGVQRDVSEMVANLYPTVTLIVG